MSMVFGFTFDDRHVVRMIEDMHEVSANYFVYESLPLDLQQLVTQCVNSNQVKPSD